MKRKIAVIWLSWAMVLNLIVIIVQIAPVIKSANIIYVDDVPGTGPGNPAENYTSIQDAINASSDGDTVFVYGGIYYENVIVNKTINLIGISRKNTTIDGSSGFADIIRITSECVNISGFTITGAKFIGGGINIMNVGNCSVFNNDILSNLEYGISLDSSSNNMITNNNISDIKSNGIWIYYSLNNSIIGNNISNNKGGIAVFYSLDNNITNNNISSSEWKGIRLFSSSNINIMGNSFFNDGLIIEGDQISHFNSHNIPSNNFVNGDLLHFYKNLNGLDIDGIPVGQLFLVNCTNINVSNLNLGNTSVGIEVAYSKNINLIGSSISNSSQGIYIHSSLIGNISYNNITSCTDKGIYIKSSINNMIVGNNLIGNYASLNNDGIRLSNSSNNNISNNNIISNSRYGIALFSSSNNNILNNNNISSSNFWGILLSWSSINTLKYNNFTNDGVFLDGYEISHFNSHNISTNNIVNGKPLYYYKDISGLDIDGISCGQLILANCTNIDIKNLNISNTDTAVEIAFSTNILLRWNNLSSNTKNGLFLANSSYVTVANNYLSNNSWAGILLESSSFNTIIYNYITKCNTGIEFGVLLSGDELKNNLIACNEIVYNAVGIDIWYSVNGSIIGNNLSSNTRWAIYAYLSSNALIYSNNIIGNFNQAVEGSYVDQWDNGYPIGGNYWSDYTGIDLNSTPTQDVPPPDGIGDTPYVLDSDSQDNYPLMNPIGDCLYLFEGWNLISVPFIQSDTEINSVLSPITGSYDALQFYNSSDIFDKWKHNHNGKPSYMNDLENIDNTMGFWIHITNPGGVLYEYPGSQQTSNQIILLQPGWNMVGYPSQAHYNRTKGLNNLTFGSEVDSIWTYHTEVKRWKEVGVNDYFEVGRGYWIHAISECEWEVPI